MKIGQLLRTIRTNKSMSLAQVADAQISSSYLSKIERDQSDITVTKLAHLLERLSTTPEEFLFLVTAGREHDYATRDRLLGTYFGQTLELSADPKDFPKAIQVMKEEISRAQAAFDRHPNLKQQLAVNARVVILATFQSLVVDKAHQLPIRPDLTHATEQYLQRIENWGEFDIYLFIIFSIAMPPVTQRRLLTLALKRSRHYSHYRSAPRLIFYLLDNQITLEFLRQNYDMVATYLNQLKIELVEQQDAEFALRAKFRTGELQVRYGQRDTGAAMLNEAVQIANTLKLSKLADYFNYARRIILNESATSAYKYFGIYID